MREVLPLTAALVPLIIAPGFLFYFDVTPKIAILLLGVAVSLPWFAPRRELRWLYVFLSIQAASLLASTVFSRRIGLSIFGSSWRRFGLITQLTLLLYAALAASDLAGGRRRLGKYLRAATAAAIPISLYGIVQYFGWDPWIPKQAYHVGGGIWTIVRPPGTLGYVSYFANYLVSAVFFGSTLYIVEERGWWKRAGAVAAVLATCAIVLSGTRAAILALVVGAAWLWFWQGRPVRPRTLAIAAAALAAIALFISVPAGQLLRSRIHWYAEDTRGGARLLLWRDSLTLASRHWLAGSGPETFSSEFPQVQSAALSRAYPSFYHESAHNILLDALTAQGAAGLLALAGFIGLGFHAAWRARRTERALSGTLGACLIALVVTHQFTVFTLPTALYFYLTVAMLAPLKDRSLLTEPRPQGAFRTGAYTLIASAPLAILAIRMLAADHMLQQVQTSLQAGKPVETAQTYQRARNWGLTADLWYSRQTAAAAVGARDPQLALISWQQALELGFRATRTADDPYNAWYSLASLHARQNDLAPTEQCLREAISSSPNWFKPHWMLAQVLQVRGSLQEAKSEAARAVDLDGGKDPEVAQTLARLEAKKE